MNDKDKKVFGYTSAIVGAIGELIENGMIDVDDLNEGDNLTHFFHALANVAPTRIYNEMTEDIRNQLQFNHLANQLCFQYSKSD